MNDVPRQTLKHIVQQYGPDVCEDARRCVGLLRDLCGEYRREIFVLMTALEHNVVDSLRTLTDQLPFSVVLPRLAAELHETTALSEEAARWAVAVWAEALDLVSEVDIESTLSRYGGAKLQPNAAQPGTWYSGSGETSHQPGAQTGSVAGATVDYQLTYEWIAHEGEVSSVAFSPNGHHLISVGMDARARIWDVVGAHEEASLNQQTGILTAAAWHPDGQMLALGSGDTGIYLWHWKDPAAGVPRFRGHQGGVTGLTFLSGGTVLASSSQDGTLRLWDALAGTVTATLRGHTDAVLDLAVSPDSATLVSAGGWDRSVRLWDIGQRHELWSLRGHTAQVTAVSFGRTGHRIASGGWDETVRLWDSARGRAIAALRVEPSPLPDGQSGADHDEAARLITSVALAPDGGIVAASDWSGNIQLWDTGRQALLTILAGHTARVRRVAFGPGGRWLASADDAGTVGLWRRQ
jgi:WD40 repeat protein